MRAVGVAGLLHQAEAEFFENGGHFALIERHARQALHFAERKVDDAIDVGDRARDNRARGLAAAEFQDHSRREVEAGHAKGRIDAAFKAVSRVGDDAELAARAGDVQGIPQRAFDQHVGGVLVAAGALAAHDAGDGFDAVVVANDHVFRAEPIGLAVEREDVLAVVRAAHDKIAFHLARVEHMQRAAAVEGQVVGDIHKRVDRAQADALKAFAHPVGRRAVLDAAHEAQRESRRETPVFGAEVEGDADRAIERAFNRLDGFVLQHAEAGGGEVARDAVNAGGVGAVGRHVDVDDRLVKAGVVHVARADGRVGGQFDDAVMLVGEFEFRGRTQHAVGIDAADVAFGQRDLLRRDVGSDRREHALHARARVGRAADDLNRRAGARVHHADAQTVGVRMLLRLDDMGDDEILQRVGGIAHFFDLEADARQRVDDFGEGSVGLKTRLEPGQGQFHLLPAVP